MKQQKTNKTRKQLLQEIKKLAGLPVNNNYWFNRKDQRTIIGKVNPAVRFVSDDKKKKKYVRTLDLFPKYFPNWEDQKTANTHPEKKNLVVIHKLLSKHCGLPHVATPGSNKSVRPRVTKPVLKKITPQWKQDLISAIKSLPDNTNHWSGRITGVGQVSINTRGKHDK